MDVAVDIRKGSPIYGCHVAVELSSESGCQLFVPVGFLHGFVTLEPDTEVAYKVSDFYHPSLEGGINWRDPRIGIDWGVMVQEATLSEKDAALPSLADFDSPFNYDGSPMELRNLV